MTTLNRNLPVTLRKIPVKKTSIRGTSPDGKAFESLLERDFYILLAADPTVSDYFVQSVRVPYLNNAGRDREYFPDALIHYRPDVDGTVKTSLLAEVKPLLQLERPSDKLKLQMAAATLYAKEKGWEYKVITEREIRIPRLENIIFLRPFEKRVPEPEIREMILSRVQEMRAPDVETLIAAIYNNKWNQATLLPYVWHLIGTGDIYTDLDQPMTMTTPIWRSKASL